jgi:hypothetical protein
MTEFLKSFSSLSLALSLFPLKQIENILTPRNHKDQHGPATKAMDAITSAVLDQFGGTLEATFSALDNLQRGAIAVCAKTMWPRHGYSGDGRANHTPRTHPDPATRADSSLHNTASGAGSRSRVRPMRPVNKPEQTAAMGRRL